jgi:hypothetical protein
MSLSEHIDYFIIFPLKKKSGGYDDFKVQYWRERPGCQDGKFSLVLALLSSNVKPTLFQELFQDRLLSFSY